MPTGLVQCQVVSGSNKLRFSECSRPIRTGGSGRVAALVNALVYVVHWASGQTTTIRVKGTSEGIASCAPNGPGYHDYYVASGSFVDSWNGRSGTFSAQWCNSPQGFYALPGTPFDI